MGLEVEETKDSRNGRSSTQTLHSSTASTRTAETNAARCERIFMHDAVVNTYSGIVKLMHKCDSELIESGWMYNLWAAEAWRRRNSGIACSCTHATVWRHPWIHACHSDVLPAQSGMKKGELLFMHSTQTLKRMQARTDTRSIYIMLLSHNPDIFYFAEAAEWR